MLELNQLTVPVAEMAQALAGQRMRMRQLAEQARQTLQRHAQVDQTLRDKLQRAEAADPSWRGADPLGERLDERHQLPEAPPAATLLAGDGSQIYPDPHGIALYYLVNVGVMVLRQGSGQAPETFTRPKMFYDQTDLYHDESQGLVNNDDVNFQRSLMELQVLAQLAVRERTEVAGGDTSRLLIALADGPLLPWVPQRLGDEEQRRRVGEFARELSTFQDGRIAAIPLGYVDRPRSANLLRLLHLATLQLEEIDKERLRRTNPFSELTDASLFADLAPGQRTGLFAATSEINRTYERQGHRIYFCYLNAARPGSDDLRLVRVETPRWVALDQTGLDAALAAVWADCRLTDYPYALTRADELARVSHHERDALEQMLSVEMMRQGLPVELSAKQRQKGFTGLR